MLKERGSTGAQEPGSPGDWVGDSAPGKRDPKGREGQGSVPLSPQGGKDGCHRAFKAAWGDYAIFTGVSTCVGSQLCSKTAQPFHRQRNSPSQPFPGIARPEKLLSVFLVK